MPDASCATLTHLPEPMPLFYLSLPCSKLFSQALHAEGVPGELRGRVPDPATAKVSLVPDFPLPLPVEGFCPGIGLCLALQPPCGTQRLLLCPRLGSGV